jgi:hypothetical protein
LFTDLCVHEILAIGKIRCGIITMTDDALIFISRNQTTMPVMLIVTAAFTEGLTVQVAICTFIPGFVRFVAGAITSPEIRVYMAGLADPIWCRVCSRTIRLTCFFTTALTGKEITGFSRWTFGIISTCLGDGYGAGIPLGTI